MIPRGGDRSNNNFNQGNEEEEKEMNMQVAKDIGITFSKKPMFSNSKKVAASGDDHKEVINTSNNNQNQEEVKFTKKVIQKVKTEEVYLKTEKEANPYEPITS